MNSSRSGRGGVGPDRLEVHLKGVGVSSSTFTFNKEETQHLEKDNRTSSPLV